MLGIAFTHMDKVLVAGFATVAATFGAFGLGFKLDERLKERKEFKAQLSHVRVLPEPYDWEVEDD